MRKTIEWGMKEMMKEMRRRRREKEEGGDGKDDGVGKEGDDEGL